MERITAARELAALLGSEIQSLQQFLDLLQQEQNTLARGSRDQIGAQLEEKARLLQDLTRYTRQRDALLKADRCPATREGMDTWIARAGESARGEVAALWQTVLKLAQRALQLNQTNGILIESGLRANQGAIGVLCAALNLGQVYGHDGRPQPALSNRRWGMA